jgi:hypothetical protein
MLYVSGLILVICGLLSLTLRFNPDIHLLPEAGTFKQYVKI